MHNGTYEAWFTSNTGLFMTSTYCSILSLQLHTRLVRIDFKQYRCGRNCASLVSLFRSPLRSDPSPQPHFPSSPDNGWVFFKSVKQQLRPSPLRGRNTKSIHQMSLCTLKIKPRCPKISVFIHPASHSSLLDGSKTTFNKWN